MILRPNTVHICCGPAVIWTYRWSPTTYFKCKLRVSHKLTKYVNVSSPASKWITLVILFRKVKLMELCINVCLNNLLKFPVLQPLRLQIANHQSDFDAFARSLRSVNTAHILNARMWSTCCLSREDTRVIVFEKKAFVHFLTFDVVPLLGICT